LGHTIQADLTKLEKALRGGVSACCAYEIVALTTRKVPTISDLCRRHRMVQVAMTVAWLAHVHLEKQKLQSDMNRLAAEVRRQTLRYNQRNNLRGVWQNANLEGSRGRYPLA
jgi:hypothetical protein